MSPSHVGAAGGVPATGVNVLPHASVTVGGVGATASAGQVTVEAPLGSLMVKAGISIV